MERYTIIIVLLCVLGVLKEFRPSESFLSPFLNQTKNFTQNEINQEIYPVGTYSNMSLLIFVFLLTDWLKYKPVILLQGLSGVLTWVVLIWTETIPLMQIGQISYGMYCACDVAYSSYLYAKIKKDDYRKATAQTKSAMLLGKTGSGLIGQLLVLYHCMDYMQLNFLTLAALSLFSILAWLLPPVTHTSYFHRPVAEEPRKDAVQVPLRSYPESQNAEGEISHSAIEQETVDSYSLSKVFCLWRNAMRNGHTLKWSVWAALSFCIYLQASYYIQLLWQELINTSKEDKIYHGFSNSFNSLAGALCTFAVGYVKLDWSKYGEVALSLSSVAQGGVLMLAAMIHTGLIYHYVLYALFKIFYQTSSTIVSAEIAKDLTSESYALVFGANQFFALLVQSILTLFVTKILELNIQKQFLLYGGLTVVLGVGFAVAGLVTLCHYRRDYQKTDVEAKDLEII